MYESMVCTFILVLDYVLVKLFLCGYILFLILYNKLPRIKDFSGGETSPLRCNVKIRACFKQHALRSIMIGSLSEWQSSPRHTVRIGTPD